VQWFQHPQLFPGGKLGVGDDLGFTVVAVGQAYFGSIPQSVRTTLTILERGKGYTAKLGTNAIRLASTGNNTIISASTRNPNSISYVGRLCRRDWRGKSDPREDRGDKNCDRLNSHGDR